MQTKINKAHKKPQRIIPGIIIALLLIIVVVALALSRHNSSLSSTGTTPSPTPTKGNSTIDEPQTPAPSPTPTPRSAGAPPAKPTLEKSSGNAPGSSVPAGITIEFTCEGTPGLQCDVILTDRHNPSRVISLGRKTVTSNDRGAYFALWDWTAQSGSWSVVARIYSAGGASTTSDVQALEVK